MGSRMNEGISTIGVRVMCIPSRMKDQPRARWVSPPDIVILPYCRYVQDSVRLEIQDGFITNIEGGLDAKLMADWLADNKRHPDAEIPTPSRTSGGG